MREEDTISIMTYTAIKTGTYCHSMDSWISNARKIIFTFDYPTPNNVDKEEFKKYFETTFLTTYFTDKIAFETFEQFIFKLYSKINKFLPMYNPIFSTFFNAESDDIILNHKIEHTEHGENAGENVGKMESESLQSRYPENLIRSNSLNNIDYANNGDRDKTTNEDNQSSNYDISFSEKKYGNLIDRVNNYTRLANLMENLMNEFNSLFSILF